MSKLQNYLKQATKEYAFEIALEDKQSVKVLEKKLVDLGVSALVEKPEGKPGEYQAILRYPVTGQELMTRLCETATGMVKVTDETGQTYSNKPLPKAEPVVEAVDVKATTPVVEIKKPTAKPVSEAVDISRIAKAITESVQSSLQTSMDALRNELQEEKAAAVRNQQFGELKTSASISAINENIANLQSVLVSLNNEMTKLNSTVAEALKTYNDKIGELSQTSNKVNHRVVKEVKRDDRGYITEVIEKIETEK